MPSPPDQSKQQCSIASRKPRKGRLVWPRPCRYSAWENPKRLLKLLFLFPLRKRPSLRELRTSSTAAKRPNRIAGGRHTRSGRMIKDESDDSREEQSACAQPLRYIAQQAVLCRGL